MTTNYGEDPQLKLLLLSQRLTSLKRQREYNLKEIIGEPESPNGMDTDEEEREDDNDDDYSSKSLKSNDEEIDKACTKNIKECLEEEKDDVEQIDMLSPRRHGRGDVFPGESVDIDEDFVARGSTNHDLHFQEGEDEDEGDENTIDFKPLAIDKPEAACDKTGVGFSRLADYYRHPEFLHDVRKTSNVIDVDNQNDDDVPNENLGESHEEDVVGRKRNSSSAERKRLPRKKSASNVKSARRSVMKSGLKQKSKQTLSGRLLDISDDGTPSSDPIVRMDVLFHQCVCAFPWRCVYSPQGPEHSSSDAHLNEGITKKGSHTGSDAGHQFSREDHLMGWISTKNERGARYGYGGGGRKVSSARDSNRRRKLDPFVYHRNISDSARYTFKHYQDWQAYVDEYRRYYTVGQAGMAMKSHSIPEGGGRREAVVIVRTLSESLIRPRLQEYNIPDWDDFTDLSATPMRPLHLGPGYRSGKAPEFGVTWLAAAATTHHHEVPADYRHPANRHIRLTNIRHPETTATQIKKRHQQALLDNGSTPRAGTILPHDAGVKIPVEPMHIVEDFRKGSRKERHGADMQPIGCRFLASWRPSDSTRTKSAKARSRNARGSKMDGKTSESLPGDGLSSPRGQIYSKKGSLQPVLNGQGQTRAGLLKLFTPKGLDVFRLPSGDDVTGVVTDTARQTTNASKNKSKASSAAKSVDASKWTNLPSSAEKSAMEKRSATKSGTLARKPTVRLHSETQPPEKDFLQVRGESKKDRSQDVESGDGETSQPASSSAKEKNAGVFAKTRIKLVAPYAQPLAQDNVLIGNPYMTSPHFGKEELSTTVQSTG